MGTTLLGIDLDESPVGGLIERLLSEEELEKLTDGGRDVDDASDDDTGRTGDDDTDVTDDGGTVDADETADSDAVDASGEDTDVTDGGEDTTDEDAVGTVDEETTVVVDDESDPSSIPVGSTGSGLTGGSGTSSPNDRRTAVPSPGDVETGENGEEDDGGWKERLTRPLVLKAAVALAVLGAVGVVLWKYSGKIKQVAGDKLGRGDDEDEQMSPPTTDAAADVPESRRRAKAPGRAEEETDVDEPETGEPAVDERAETPSATVSRPTDTDTGALVGLAALALVAALVRKFGEDRPRDPLVDGPADEE